MTALEWFRYFAPEYSALTDEQVAPLLAAADVFVYAPCLMGDRLNAAKALYAAHDRALQVLSSNGNGLRGAVISEKEGDLSRTYASAQKSGDATWGASIYGPRYLTLVGECFGASIMTRFGQDIPGTYPYAREGSDEPIYPRP